jgi:predicted RNA binding protein YcfA (HicA-like mRNA interferase family)
VSELPRKIRQLISDLERAGFVNRGGKGSHRSFVHGSGIVVTVSGKSGDEAPHYLERQLRLALEAITDEKR